MIAKVCPWTGNVCLHESCSFIDGTGSVHVCKFHGNKLGFFKPRLARSPSGFSVFDKHRLRRT